MTSAPLRLCAITDEPVDVAAVLAAVEDPTAGGTNLFVGHVRDHDRGKGVVTLDYEAHPSALEELRRVAEEVIEEYDVVAASVVHRVGHLAIGDVAVALAIASGHRDQAYVASRALIDRLKERVPIWKHQRFSDGDEEWVNTP